MARQKRKLSRRGYLVLGLLILAVMLFVLSLVLFRDDAPVGEIETTPYALDSSAQQRFAAMDSGLAVASGEGLQLFDEFGGLIVRQTATMSDPAVSAAGKYAAACDVGGTTLITADIEGGITEHELSNAIISARILPDGWLAVATESPGYKGMVTVYDENFDVIYEWYSGEDYVLGAGLSDSHVLAVLCAGTGGSKVHLFGMNSEEERGVFVAPDLLLDLRWVSGSRLAVLSDARLLLLTDKGVQDFEYSFSGLHLYDYAVSDNGIFALALSAYRSGGNTTLITLSDSGKVLGEHTVEKLTGVDVRGKQVLVRGGNALTLYNQQLEELRTAQIDGVGVQQAILLKNGEALLVYDYSAQAITI